MRTFIHEDRCRKGKKRGVAVEETATSILFCFPLLEPAGSHVVSARSERGLLRNLH